MSETNNTKHHHGTGLEIEETPQNANRRGDLTLIGAMKKLVEASMHNNLKHSLNSLDPDTDDELEYVMEKLGLGIDEAIIFSIFCDRGTHRPMSIENIGIQLGIGLLEALEYRKAIETLVKRGLVDKNSDEKYFVPKNVIWAMTQNEAYEVEIKECHDDESLWMELLRLFSDMSENKIARAVFYDTIDKLLGKNYSLRFAKMADRYRRELKEEEFIFLMAVGLLWVAKGQRWMAFISAIEMLRDRETSDMLLSRLRSGSSRLIKDKLMEAATGENAKNRNGFALSEKAKKEFKPDEIESDEIESDEIFPDLLNGENQNNLIAPDTIVKRTLYYNAGTARQVEELALLLSEKKMQSVLRRLQRSGLRSGFTCLFHGGPGTGKTETVMQLARRTGRAVWQVDYSEMRCKWVGDSEKNVKAEFDNYREQLSQGGPAPILLLNEADALIGKRLESPERAADKMENAIQNIVLQEMENFEGILIATTNLTTVLDQAFERRFLYKVEFEAPDADTRSKIWRSMMPSLDSDEALELANRYPDFAGGQIENISRKATVRRVLHGRKTGWDELLEMCGQEMLDSHTGHPIGFHTRNR